MTHAEALRAMLAQQLAELRRIEVIGVIRNRGEFGGAGLLGRSAMRAKMRLCAHGLGKRKRRSGFHPGADQIDIEIAVRQHERMIVTVTAQTIAPAVEARALLERRIALAEQRAFADADTAQCVADRRPRALADAYRRHVGRLDDADAQALAMIGSEDAR